MLKACHVARYLRLHVIDKCKVSFTFAFYFVEMQYDLYLISVKDAKKIRTFRLVKTFLQS